jgi:hypothetical protein
MKFTEARADVGKQLSAANDEDALLKPPATAPFTAQIDPGSGSITDGLMAVPDFTTFINDPVEADVTVEFEIGPITGSFTEATGALTLSGVAGGTLISEGKECAVSTTPAPLTLTTAGSAGGAGPLLGAAFTAGLSGPGAIAGQWTDMHAAPISGHIAFCENVAGEIGGPGGIWLEQEGEAEPKPEPKPSFVKTDPVSPPPPPPSPPPPPTRACLVPKLAGKKLGAAKRRIRAAGCQVGRVRKPRRLRRGKGTGRRALVVKSSNPGAGARPANRKVHLKLGPKHRKARR